MATDIRSMGLSAKGSNHALRTVDFEDCASTPSPDLAVAAKAPAKAAAPKSSGGDLVPGFYINVGLFAVPTNGTNAFRTLEKAELPVFTDVVKSKKGPLTRVRVGPYLSKALAGC